MTPKKVFISYSHDSPEHAARVAGLAASLRRDGVDCRIDQYVEGSPPEGWPLWMEKTLEWADFVLVICTETYLRRVRKEEPPGKGFGATWEAHLIYQHIYEDQLFNAKFIPVIFDGADKEFIPTPLRGVGYYRLDKQKGYDALYVIITGQHRPPPDIGEVKTVGKGQPPPSFGEPGGVTTGTAVTMPKKALYGRIAHRILATHWTVRLVFLAGLAAFSFWLFSQLTAPDLPWNEREPFAAFCDEEWVFDKLTDSRISSYLLARELRNRKLSYGWVGGLANQDKSNSDRYFDITDILVDGDFLIIKYNYQGGLLRLRRIIPSEFPPAPNIEDVDDAELENFQITQDLRAGAAQAGLALAGEWHQRDGKGCVELYFDPYLTGADGWWNTGHATEKHSNSIRMGP